MNKDTMTMQNITQRLEQELVLVCENPNEKIKQKFATVRKKFIELNLALLLVNDELDNFCKNVADKGDL